jgi:hypothetical protein
LSLNREAVTLLQPRVAASATLGKENDQVCNRNAVAAGRMSLGNDATALRLINYFLTAPRLAEAATLG